LSGRQLWAIDRQLKTIRAALKILLGAILSEVIELQLE